MEWIPIKDFILPISSITQSSDYQPYNYSTQGFPSLKLFFLFKNHWPTCIPDVSSRTCSNLTEAHLDDVAIWETWTNLEGIPFSYLGFSYMNLLDLKLIVVEVYLAKFYTVLARFFSSTSTNCCEGKATKSVWWWSANKVLYLDKIVWTIWKALLRDLHKMKMGCTYTTNVSLQPYLPPDQSESCDPSPSC